MSLTELPTYMKLYRRFRRETIKEASALAGLSSSTWSRIENGQVDTITTKQFVALSAALWIVITIGMSDNVNGVEEE